MQPSDYALPKLPFPALASSIRPKLVGGHYYSAKQMHDYARLAIAEAQRAAIPPGWQLVPVEPTKQMVDAACRDHGFPGGSRWVYRDGYRSMLAAAPQPPADKEAQG